MKSAQYDKGVTCHECGLPLNILSLHLLSCNLEPVSLVLGGEWVVNLGF